LSYPILTSFDRGALAQLVKTNISLHEIAEKLGFSKSTIHYELSRIKPYNPILAQEDADRRRKRCGRKTILNDHLKIIVENHLKLTWSPEMIAHNYQMNTSSIYNWLNKGIINFDVSNLPNRNVRHLRKDEQRGTFKVNQTIENRPDYINLRSEFGHWEVDTVLSSRGKDKTCLATFVERKSRFLWAVKIPNRSKLSLNMAFNKFMNIFNPIVKSITVDHGK
jgi:IS30 family transposase